VRQLTLQYICNPDARTLDPDNDYRSQRLSQGVIVKDRVKTNNYVKYQRGNANYEHPTRPNAAMVCACGKKDFRSLVCMAAVHPGAIALHGGYQISHISQLTASLMNKAWLPYGGKDVLNTVKYESRMRYADESMHMLFHLGTLLPGESTTFSTSHILNADEMSRTLSSLGGINILQPIDLMTGTSVPFVVGELQIAKSSINIKMILPYRLSSV
jgi:hypothetical protein